MNLKDLGYNDAFERFRIENNLMEFEIGRIISEHKERYIVKTEKGESEAEITGNLRFSAKNREDFPAVGDWVALTNFDPDFAIIHKILPRSSVIKRQAVGQRGEVQVIAANIDYALIVQAADRDFSINRLERYLTICNSSKVIPVILISKTDLLDQHQVSEILRNVQARINNVQVIPISNETQAGYEGLLSTIKRGKTYCILGSSGVGKSTLINNLSGKTVMRTEIISKSTNRGRHITSHRELIVLENGGILIDNPGMREVGIADSTGGLEITFDKILHLAQRCKYKDCTHSKEAGCAVLEAVGKGELDEAAYDNYLKMEREKVHFETSVAERRKKEKLFGKIVRDYYKQDIKKRRH